MPLTPSYPASTAVRDLENRLLGQASAWLGCSLRKWGPGVLGLAGRQLEASLFPLGLEGHPFSGRSDQMCWEGLPIAIATLQVFALTALVV